MMEWLQAASRARSSPTSSPVARGLNIGRERFDLFQHTHTYYSILFQHTHTYYSILFSTHMYCSILKPIPVNVLWQYGRVSKKLNLI